MNVSALNQKVENLPLVLTADTLAWDGPLATFHTTWTVNPRNIGRAEIAGLVLLSIVLHSVVAVRLARPGVAEPVVHEQQVNIEIMRPPPAVKPLIPPPAPPPEKPAPVLRKTAAEPRVVARLEPVARPTQAPSTPNELPALPEGDDPALAAPSGTGTASAPPPPVVAVLSAPPPPAPAPVRAIAAHEGANYLKNPRPAYPEIAQRRNWEGEVLLRVHVTSDGRPTQISIQRSSGRDVLDLAAIEAVRGWSFVPARIGNQTVAGWVNVPIVFHLQ
ncbi:MAG TPA: energy transducer TonB [Polyangia bacterium]